MVEWLIGYGLGFVVAWAYIGIEEPKSVRQGASAAPPWLVVSLVILWPVLLLLLIWAAVLKDKPERKCKTPGCPNRPWAAGASCDACFDKTVRKEEP